MPLNFCKSYTNIRASDIQETPNLDKTTTFYDDKFAHFNNHLSDVSTIELPQECVREVFKSINVAEPDGSFKIKQLCDQFANLSNQNLSVEEYISKKLEIFSNLHPDFATCPNSTQSILPYILQFGETELEDCVVQRVYERVDKEKKPITYAYLRFPNESKIFYYADTTSNSFKSVTQERFEEMFECYAEDLEQTSGMNPWDDIDTNEIQKSEVDFYDYASTER